MPAVGAGRRGAVAGVLPLGVCQHVDAGPVREQAEPRLLLPDRRRCAAGRRSGRRSTCATSTSRRCGTSRSTRSTRATSCTTSTCARSSRRSASRPSSRPTSFVEGWAHYCEQMMVEAGFRTRRCHASASDSSPRRWCGWRASSSASACTAKTCRWSRGCASSATRRSSRRPPRGVRPSAARSIRRYLVYSVGKLMMLKLRHDYKEQQGGKFSLRGVPRCRARARAARRSGRTGGCCSATRQGRRSTASPAKRYARCRCTNTNATPAAAGSK